MTCFGFIPRHRPDKRSLELLSSLFSRLTLAALRTSKQTFLYEDEINNNLITETSNIVIIIITSQRSRYDIVMIDLEEKGKKDV